MYETNYSKLYQVIILRDRIENKRYKKACQLSNRGKRNQSLYRGASYEFYRLRRGRHIRLMLDLVISSYIKYF